MEKFDIAIIGAGPGGYVAAIEAARSGKKVALIEKQYLGGTCLNVGCIPTKTLLASANFFNNLKTAKDLGIHIENISIDFPHIQKRKNEVIKNLQKGVEGLIKANKISLFMGTASFISTNEIKINDTHILADKIIIATGSTPMEAKAFPCDGKFIHNSTSILNIEKLPKSIAIIGGGYIGCEFASFFNSLGTKVYIIEASPKIIAEQDISLIEALTKHFTVQGIKILTSAKVTKVEKTNSGVKIELENGKVIESEICLSSIGRKVNTEDLNLKKTNVATDERGFILTNDKMQTNVDHIYAIGDVNGKYMLAHTASHEGTVAAKNITGVEAFMYYDAIPSVIFTSPEIASVGLTEKQAKENHDIKTAVFPLSYLGKAQASLETQGFVKLIADTATNQILGAHMFGHEASTMIAEMSVAISNELTLECIADTIHAHPTMPEAWLEAALLLNNTPIHHLPKK